MSSLLPYQIPHEQKMLKAFKELGYAVDGSDPGTGKTYVGSSIANKLNMPVLVACPKVSIPVWRRVLESFGVEVIDVVNFEKLRTGKTPYGVWTLKKRQFLWQLPPNALLIFDEAQRCKAKDSQNAAMLRDAKGRPLLILSATLADSPLDLRAVAHVTGMSDWNRFWNWLMQNGCKKGRFGVTFDKNRKDVLGRLHEELFVKRGSRISIADLGDAFPDTQITAEALDFGDEIDKIYKTMDAELTALEEASEHDKPAQQLTIQLRARQSVELCKVPGIVQLTEDFLADGKSVVIFTNFRATLEALCERLGTTCAVYGGQPASWRQKCIDDFQANKERVIIVNIAAGGVSVSLHDVHNTHPRVALLCPTYSGIELKQALGRVWRSGGTKSLQRILFAAGTVEEIVCQRVNAKLARMDLINDGVPSFNDAELDPAKNNLNETTRPVSDLGTGLIQQHIMTPTEPEAPTEKTETLCKPATTLEHQDRSHAKHSPSTLNSKLNCGGWFNDPDPNKDRTAADRGSLGHEMVEKEDFGMAPQDLELTNAAVTSWEWMKRFERKGTSHYRELKLQIQDQYGHLDHLYVHTDNSGDLIDLKFARNIYRADTPQFWAYMIGAWDMFPELDVIRVWVLHPFLDHIDTETYSRTEDYDRLNALIRAIIVSAENPDPANFRVGKHCTYCGRLAQAKCPKFAQLGIDIAARYATEEEKYKVPTTGTLHASDLDDPNIIAALWRIAPLVKKATEGWRKRALEAWEEGIALPGLEYFEKAGTREITSAAGAFDAVKDRVAPEDFIQACDVKITDLEKLFAETFPRGEKGSSKKVLMQKLTDASAISTGAPVPMLRELK